MHQSVPFTCGKPPRWSAKENILQALLQRKRGKRQIKSRYSVRLNDGHTLNLQGPHQHRDNNIIKGMDDKTRWSRRWYKLVDHLIYFSSRRRLFLDDNDSCLVQPPPPGLNAPDPGDPLTSDVWSSARATSVCFILVFLLLFFSVKHFQQ